MQPIIAYGLELIESVTDFLDKVKFVTDELDPFTRVLESESSNKLDHYLRELDFSCNSVALAVSIARAQSSGKQSDRFISPGALLRASRTIAEMSNRSGDLVATKGSLYRKVTEDSEWALLGSDFVYRVSQFKFIDPHESPYVIRLSTNSENLNFPIQTALSLKISTIREAGLPISILVDSPVVVWNSTEEDDACLSTSVGPSVSSKRRLLHRNPSGEMDPDLTRLSLDSDDGETLIVHGPADVPSRLRPRISSTHIGGSHVTAYHAFVCENSKLPIDIVYVSRLCVLEAVRNYPNGENMTCSPKSTSPLHFDASDEAITALLCDAYVNTDIIQTPSTEPSTFPDDRESPDIKLVVEDV